MRAKERASVVMGAPFQVLGIVFATYGVGDKTNMTNGSLSFGETYYPHIGHLGSISPILNAHHKKNSAENTLRR